MGKRDRGAVCQGSVMHFLRLLSSVFFLSWADRKRKLQAYYCQSNPWEANTGALDTLRWIRNTSHHSKKGVWLKTVQHSSVIHRGLRLRMIFSLDILLDLPICPNYYVSAFQSDSENTHFHLTSQKETLAEYAYFPTSRQKTYDLLFLTISISELIHWIQMNELVKRIIQWLTLEQTLDI